MVVRRLTPQRSTLHCEHSTLNPQFETLKKKGKRKLVSGVERSLGRLASGAGGPVAGRGKVHCCPRLGLNVRVRLWGPVSRSPPATYKDSAGRGRPRWSSSAPRTPAWPRH